MTQEDKDKMKLKRINELEALVKSLQDNFDVVTNHDTTSNNYFNRRIMKKEVFYTRLPERTLLSELVKDEIARKTYRYPFRRLYLSLYELIHGWGYKTIRTYQIINSVSRIVPESISIGLQTENTPPSLTEFKTTGIAPELFLMNEEKIIMRHKPK